MSHRESRRDGRCDETRDGRRESQVESHMESRCSRPDQTRPDQRFFLLRLLVGQSPIPKRHSSDARASDGRDNGCSHKPMRARSLTRSRLSDRTGTDHNSWQSWATTGSGSDDSRKTSPQRSRGWLSTATRDSRQGYSSLVHGGRLPSRQDHRRSTGPHHPSTAQPADDHRVTALTTSTTMNPRTPALTACHDRRRTDDPHPHTKSRLDMDMRPVRP